MATTTERRLTPIVRDASNPRTAQSCRKRRHADCVQGQAAHPKVPGAGPLVVEASSSRPAPSADALGRIGETIVGWPGGGDCRPAVSGDRVAARGRLLAAGDLHGAFGQKADVRFPSNGWIEGGLADLAGTVETVAVRSGASIRPPMSCKMPFGKPPSCSPPWGPEDRTAFTSPASRRWLLPSRQRLPLPDRRCGQPTPSIAETRELRGIRGTYTRMMCSMHGP